MRGVDLFDQVGLERPVEAKADQRMLHPAYLRGGEALLADLEEDHRAGGDRHVGDAAGALAGDVLEVNDRLNAPVADSDVVAAEIVPRVETALEIGRVVGRSGNGVFLVVAQPVSKHLEHEHAFQIRPGSPGLRPSCADGANRTGRARFRNAAQGLARLGRHLPAPNAVEYGFGVKLGLSETFRGLSLPGAARCATKSAGRTLHGGPGGATVSQG